MKKRIALYILPLLLIISFASAAQIDNGKALSWINQNIDVNSNIRDVSLASLALQSSNYSIKSQSLISSLESRMDEQGCFPKGNCKVRDTAFALMALNSFSKKADKTAKWLEDASSPSGTSGNWFIQIATKNSGACELSSGSSIRNVTINDNQNTECGSPWISVGSGQCFDVDLSSNAITEVVVDCTSLSDPDVKISLLKINYNEFTIVSQPSGGYVSLNINNVCWGLEKDASCDIDSTAYAYWALSQISRIEEPPFLVSAQNKDALHYSILYKVTNQNVYYKWLTDNEDPVGFWSDQSIFKTAIATDSLASSTNRSKSINWLASQQKEEGSFGNDVGDTAAVIYFTLPKSKSSGFSGGALGYCGDDVADASLGEECDGQDDDACPRQCTDSCKCPVKPVTCVTHDDCTPLYCDTTTGKCVECLIDNNCNEGEVCNVRINRCEEQGIFPITEDNQGSSLSTLFIIIGIIIVAVGIYFVYKKSLKKKPSGGEKPGYLKDNKPKPASSTYYQKPAKKYSPQDEHLEKELDRSIREAQQLLKRK